MAGVGDVRVGPTFQGVRLLAKDLATSGSHKHGEGTWQGTYIGVWKVMAASVTWSRLLGVPGGQSKIVAQVDFGDILPHMHP